jgi:hypothetical protein
MICFVRVFTCQAKQFAVHVFHRIFDWADRKALSTAMASRAQPRNRDSRRQGGGDRSIVLTLNR